MVTSEFSSFDRTAERLDVLAVDARGSLTVVELKRSAVGTAAELQALRYAAYCSTLSLQAVAEMLAEYESARTGTPISPEEAGRRIRAFVNDPDFVELDNRPRIILGAEEFPPRDHGDGDLAARVRARHQLRPAPAVSGRGRLRSTPPC